MDERLLKILRCIECKSVLLIDNEIKLTCSNCKKEYEIRNGIPRFVKNDAYADTFSFEWKKHAKTQLDSHNKWNHTEVEFLGSWPFPPTEFRDKLILDAGCGMGRFAEIALKYGAVVVGVDLSYAVEIAEMNLRYTKNFLPVQADLFQLPFDINSFDYIYSFGVLHHTPNARKAFLAITPLLKQRGGFSINVYSKYHLTHVVMTQFYRKLVKKLGIKPFWYVCYFLALMHYVCKIAPLRKILLAVAPLRIGINYSWTHLDTFDWYTPYYMSFHDHVEVDGWYTEAGMTNFRIVKGQIGFFGRKGDG